MRTCEQLDFGEERQMNAEHATPEVIDALARIEIERREKEKESGVPVSCNWALGKLYELLPGERKSPGTNAGTALLARCAEKILRKPAPKGDEPPGILAIQGAAARRDCRWRLAPARRSDSSSS